MPAVRYAVSYTPPLDSPLARFGAAVLGYDCFDRIDVPHRAIAGIDPAILRLTTLEPRRHGFHVALVAPFDLSAAREDDLITALDRFTRHHRPVPVGALAPARLGRFVVLCPEPSVQFDALATACREAFGEFCAPAEAPEEFRPHLTLAGPIPDDEIESFKDCFAVAFRPMAADQLEIDAVSLMRQDDRAARFHVVERRRLSRR